LTDTDKGEGKYTDEKGNTGGDVDRAQESGKGDLPVLIYPPGYTDVPTFVTNCLGDVNEHAMLGGFAAVTTVKILQGNGIKGLKSNAKFALKKFYDKSETAFNNEVEAMRRLAAIRDPHIVELKAAFTQNGSHYLLMDLATGNLRDFWRFIPDPTAVGDGLIIWVIEQCAGLTKALVTIHSSTGSKPVYRHGDIKPENILWYQKEKADAGDHKKHLGVLQIADFGGVEVIADTEPETGSDWIRYSPTYRPPELDINTNVSCASDIWSLGCIFLEFVTWYLSGWEAAEEVFPTLRLAEGGHDGFREDTFFLLQRSKEHKTAILGPAVQKVSASSVVSGPSYGLIARALSGSTNFTLFQTVRALYMTSSL
jgi:serine/threonine protein kinase